MYLQWEETDANGKRQSTTWSINFMKVVVALNKPLSVDSFSPVWHPLMNDGSQTVFADLSHYEGSCEGLKAIENRDQRPILLSSPHPHNQSSWFGSD